MSVVSLPEIAYIYPEPFWTYDASDWLKSLLLFFDGVATLVPSYMLDRPGRADTTLVEPLLDAGLLHQLQPETFVDQASAEALAEAITRLIAAESFSKLDSDAPFLALSMSRLGWGVDEGLARMLHEELRKRGLARKSDDGVTVHLHRDVRALVLVLLSQILRAPGRALGLDLQPTTPRQDAVVDLMRTLNLSSTVTSGRVVAFDLENVGLNLEAVPLDEVLSFRESHGSECRAYRRSLHTFVNSVSRLDEGDRAVAFRERQEELADSAHQLRRRLRLSFAPKNLGSFALGIAGAAFAGIMGNWPSVPFALAGGAYGLVDATKSQTSFSYLFSAQRSISQRTPS